MKHTFLCLVAVAACAQPSSMELPQGGCTHSFECAVGDVCGAQNTCVPAGHEMANTCVGGVCCDGAGTCLDSYESLCEDGGCVCHILHSGGTTALAGLPRLVLPGGVPYQVTAVLARTSGEPLPSGPFALSVSNSASVVASGTQLVGTDVAGHARISATFGRSAQCDADVMNLGPRASDTVRLTLVDAYSGQPIAGAHVVLDTNKDGQDDGAAEPSDAQGTAHAELMPPYDMTVFAEGYEYFSVADVQQADIALRLVPQQKVGGTQGLLDVSGYEQTVLGGRSLPFVLGLAAPSFSPARLWDFELDLLFGGESPSSSCDVMPAPGCYAFDIPGLFAQTIPTFGGLILSLGHKPLKPFFEVTGEPGRRHVWGFGGEFTASDMAQVFSHAMSYAACSCDVTNACDGSCTCDADCGGSMASRLVRTLLPLLPRTALGLVGNVEMAPASYDDWVTHITEPYGETRRVDQRFPMLEGEKALASSHAIAGFADLTLPALPLDPQTQSAMDSVVVVSGVSTLDAGFVPLGLGAAFDCKAASCPGPLAVTGAVSPYDGIVSEQTFCASSETPCPANKVRSTQAGHAPLFVGQAPEALAQAPWRTVVMSLPLDTFSPQTLRMSALVVHGAPTATLSLAGQTFLPLPKLPKRQGRTVRLVTGSDAAGVSRLRLAGISAARWTVVGQSGDATMVLPEVPHGFADPLADTEPVGTFVSLSLTDTAPANWLLHQGRGLDDVFHQTRGFATTKGVLFSSP